VIAFPDSEGPALPTSAKRVNMALLADADGMHLAGFTVHRDLTEVAPYVFAMPIPHLVGFVLSYLMETNKRVLADILAMKKEKGQQGLG
jgi:hypothetical protein